MNTKTETATSAYVRTLEKIKEQLDTLQNKEADFFGVSPEDLNWADVGSLNHVLSLLRQANGEEE